MNYLVRIWIVFLFLTIVFSFGLLIENFYTPVLLLFWNMGVALGSRALSFALWKLGLKGRLALAISFFLLRGILTAEGASSSVNFMMPAEGTSGLSSLNSEEDFRNCIRSLEEEEENSHYPQQEQQPAANPTEGQLAANPEAAPPLPEHPGNPPSIPDFAELLDTDNRLPDIIQDICREIGTRVPGGSRRSAWSRS